MIELLIHHVTEDFHPPIASEVLKLGQMGGCICHWLKEPTPTGGHVQSLTWLVGRSPQGATEAHDQGTLGRAVCQDACSG